MDIESSDSAIEARSVLLQTAIVALIQTHPNPRAALDAWQALAAAASTSWAQAKFMGVRFGMKAFDDYRAQLDAHFSAAAVDAESAPP